MSATVSQLQDQLERALLGAYVTQQSLDNSDDYRPTMMDEIESWVLRSPVSPSATFQQTLAEEETQLRQQLESAKQATAQLQQLSGGSQAIEAAHQYVRRKIANR